MGTLDSKINNNNYFCGRNMHLEIGEKQKNN